MFRVEACYLDFVEKCTTLVEMQHLIKKSTLVRYEQFSKQCCKLFIEDFRD